MSKPIIFIQVHGRPGILEAELSEAATLGELHEALAAAGVPLDAETSSSSMKPRSRCTASMAAGRWPEARLPCSCHPLQAHQDHGSLPRQDRGARVPARRARARRQGVGGAHLQAEPEGRRRARPAALQFDGAPAERHAAAPARASGTHCALCFDLVPEKRVEG